MKIEPIESIDQIKKILTIVGLPTEDLPQLTNAKFFGITDNSALLAVVGLELYGEAGLLRSLAVLPSSQGTGIGNNLVRYAEEAAIKNGVNQLYLLTTTAEAYFRRLHYMPALRNEAPEVIRATAQFSGLCPASAAFLVKQLRK